MNLPQKHIESLKLTASEKATIAKVCKRVQELSQMLAPYVQTGRGRVKDARAIASHNPTEQTLADLADAITREAAQEEIARQCKAAVGVAANAACDELQPIACRVLDAIAAGVRADHAAHIELLNKSPLGEAVDKAAAERVVQSNIDWLETQRGRVIREHAALEVLQGFGLTEAV